MEQPVVPSPPPISGRALEALFGTRVLLGAGLLSLLLGIAFFVSVGRQQIWIPPEIRVLLGLLVGTGLMTFGAARIRTPHSYAAEGLSALGASALYLSIWSAFGPLHLEAVSFPVAFTAMIAVTCALAAIALVRRAERLAVMGAAGGFLTPLLLGTALTSLGHVWIAAYVLTLCGVMLLLASHARFRMLEATAFLGALASAPWFAIDNTWPYTASMTVATLLFVEFAVALWFAARREGNADPLRLSVIVLDVAAYVLVLECELSSHQALLGSMLCALSAVLLAAVALPGTPRIARTAYASLGLAALAAAFPALFHTFALAVAFAVEASVLVALGTRGANLVVRGAGYVLFMVSLGVIAVFPPLGEYHPIDNARFLSVAIVVASLALTARSLAAYRPLLRNDERNSPEIFGAMAHAVAIWAVGSEIGDAFADGQVRQTAYTLLGAAYASALTILGMLRRRTTERIVGLAFFAATILKIYTVDLASVDMTYRALSFLVLGSVLVLVAALYARFVKRSGAA